MSSQISAQWPGSLVVVAVFFLAILAIVLVAWGGGFSGTSDAAFPLLPPGQAALYRVHYGSGQSGLYSLHVAHPGPFPLDPSSNHSLVRLKETYIGRPGESDPIHTTVFYTQDADALRLLGSLEAYGGTLYTPTISGGPNWNPGGQPTLTRPGCSILSAPGAFPGRHPMP